MTVSLKIINIMVRYDMNEQMPEYQLEFLLAFDGRIHHLEEGYWVKFEIKRVTATDERPHGLSYSFTLHAPDGRRLIGFDNAHRVPAIGSRFKRRPPSNDHWHRTENDPGRPYPFTDAETLIDDFFGEVERVLGEQGIATDVIEVEETRRSE
ncbi:MAG: DUF6516 family protein [Aliidongia sp.]